MKNQKPRKSGKRNNKSVDYPKLEQKQENPKSEKSNRLPEKC